MFQITSNSYNRIASELRDAISPTTIFSGSIEFEIDEVQYKFVATIIPYYHQERFPEGAVKVLYDIVPVWWELRTTTTNGEVINDFDFETLKFLICQQ
ncbi:MAG: hypothetical protein R3Y39_02720 [Rikenellaceae bacterium]